ncbi:hypothetical protein [Cellulomonas flavigena]|uniref:hypothetical protein n=1 Tax=Cellulomonas flavigena TaxID=1711 RepID=UPI0002D4B16F|nr:hypothetical protein [Cellulomonas flavigena]
MDDATPNRQTARPGLRGWLRDLGAVVALGGRLWVRSWPVLLLVALLAVAGRYAAGWAAVNAAGYHGALGWAVLVLAPLSMVAGIVAMLHVLRRDLPDLARADASSSDGNAPARSLLDVLASVFVPFLALYASYGYLAEDRGRFFNTAAAREFNEGTWLLGEGADFSFTELATGWALVAVVVVAVVLRWLLGRWEKHRHSRPLAFAGAYVEAFWLLVVAAYVTELLGGVWAWVESRRAVAIVLDAWLRFLEAIGPVAGPVDTVVDAVAGVLGNLDDLVVIPLAWLTVGAVVYGHKLADLPKRKPGGPAAWRRVPAPVRRWTTEAAAPVVGDVRGRFRALTDGLRRLALAGLGPMLVFALAFLVATRVEEGLALLARATTGPQDVDTWLAFAPMVTAVATAVGLTLTMALLAAGVHRMLAGQAAVSEPADVAAP